MEINKGEGEQEGRRRLIKVKEYRGWTEINKGEGVQGVDGD